MIFISVYRNEFFHLTMECFFKEYISFLDTAVMRKNNRVAEILCKKYNMEFWDYAIDHDFIKYEFFNPDHLNKKGAERFSKMLDSRLKLYNN